ncbi:probable G-protein coupled receptor 83 [Amblyraja radiata]|uniref:probable G-protein coupled receptor 83 n=1 Tax=Amblyraja radiata TaxID=386614 RepID=UPI001402955F|nr:probable G-protein coupled receptor 83 [Amblyraja radiata]
MVRLRARGQQHGLQPEILKVQDIVPGRLLYLAVCLDGVPLHFINVYAPKIGAMQTRLTREVTTLLNTIDHPESIGASVRSFYKTLFSAGTSSGEEQEVLENIIRRQCVPTFLKPSDVFRWNLDLSTFVLLYLLQLVVITVATVAVSKKLWLRKTIGVITVTQAATQRRRKKRTIKMIVLLLVVAFALCWFPLNVYTVLLTGQRVQFNNTLYFAFHRVAVSSTCWNSFIYCWMDNRFRSDLMTLLAKCGWRRRRGGKSSGDGRQSG